MNLCGVSFIDAAGKALLKQIHQQGGKLVAEGCLNQAIVREISADSNSEKNGVGPTKKTPIIFYVLFAGIVAGQWRVAAGAVRRGANALPSDAPSGVMRLTLDQAVAPGAEAKHHRADRGHSSGGSGARQERRARSAVAASQSGRQRLDPTHQPGSKSGSAHPGISPARWPDPGFSGRTIIFGAGVRLDFVAALPGAAIAGERGESRTAFRHANK